MVLSYYTNNKRVYDSVYMLFPPGAHSGKYFQKILDKIPKNALVIAVDHPGRGGSSITNNNSIAGVAEYLSTFVKILDVRKPITFVGASYGTAVINELVKRVPDYMVKELILVAPGEYINKIYHPFIRALFIPAIFSNRVRVFYRKFLIRYTPFFSSFPKTNLEQIMKQWFGILDYKIDTNAKFNFPVRVLTYTHDTMVRKKSPEKIRLVYPQSIFLQEFTGHNLDIQKFSDPLLKVLFSDHII